MEGKKQDPRELKKLQKELRDVKDTTLWSLLVDLMQRDTEKHIAILDFAQTTPSNALGLTPPDVNAGKLGVVA